MPGKGGAYKITKEWQDLVRKRIAEMEAAGEVDGQNGLARKAGIAKASLSSALKLGAIQTTKMVEIHRALGWPAPRTVTIPRVLGVIEAFEKLDEFERGQQLERLRQMVEGRRAR